MPPVILAPIDLGSETPLAPAGAGPSRPGPDRTILSARYDHCIVDLHPFLLAEADTVTPQQRAKTDRLEPDEARAHDEPPRGGAIRVSMTNSFKFLQYGSVSTVDFWDLQRFCRVPSPSTHRHLSCLSLPLCRVKRWACPADLPNQFLPRSISPHVLRPSW